MITVGVRELKDKLSHYLTNVKRGRLVAITKRGQIMAILIPAPHPEAKLASKLIRKGIGSWKGGKPKGATRRFAVEGKPISQILLEERR